MFYGLRALLVGVIVHMLQTHRISPSRGEKMNRLHKDAGQTACRAERVRSKNIRLAFFCVSVRACVLFALCNICAVCCVYGEC